LPFTERRVSIGSQIFHRLKTIYQPFALKKESDA
jgi:hypothetical protein